MARLGFPMNANDYTSTERRLVNPAALLGSGSLIRYESVLEALSGRSMEK
jgi:hypothetical protein